ncbi:MAG: hypothetical protein K8R21_06980, partial [Leptospira sp.]|nr:hypothetical protein [Leptospira sp.]
DEIQVGSSIEDPGLVRIKEKILKNYDSFLEFSFLPINFITTDLKGGISVRTEIPVEAWIKKNDIGSERELELVHFLYEELYKSIKASSNRIDRESLEMLCVYLLSQNRLEDFISLVEIYDRKGNLPPVISVFMGITGIAPENLETDFIAEGNDPVFTIYKWLRSKNPELENELYDFVVSRKYQQLLGLVFSIYSERITGLRTVYPLYQMIIKQFSQLPEEEKKFFISKFQETHHHLIIYFLMKQVYTREQIHQHFREEMNLNGKSSMEKGSSIIPELHLDQKYKNLREQGLTHTLGPFEILVLLNSNESYNVREDILAAFNKFPHSYIVNRSMATLNFFDRDFDSFLNFESRCGRLRFHPEMIYFRGVVCCESGFREEGKALLTSLSQKFPDSEMLKKATEEYRLN